MSPLRADMRGSSSVAAAMEMWNDAQMRKKLQSVGVMGGYYRAMDAGNQVLVESELVFKDGGKVRYRQYHPKHLGFPNVVDIVKIHLKLRHRNHARLTMPST